MGTSDYTPGSIESLIVTVRCTQPCEQGDAGAILTLNEKRISRDGLRDAIRSELSRNIRAVVYIRAQGDVTAGQIIRMVDTVRDGWFDVPVVLLTPQLEKSLKP
jgi:hypothetical protein